jgi:hypothetical protein
MCWRETCRGGRWEGLLSLAASLRSELGPKHDTHSLVLQLTHGSHVGSLRSSGSRPTSLPRKSKPTSISSPSHRVCFTRYAFSSLCTRDKVKLKLTHPFLPFLYQRFAYIMCISVMKHTESTVKFWFIENFLSPSFLVRSVLPPSDPETVIDSLTGLVLSSMQEFIPHLAMEYGFDYELVT